MAGSLNRVILIGHLGRDPEIRYAPDGTKIVQFPVATGETWKDKVTGERRDKTEWHRVVIFNDRLADIAERFLHKGSRAYIEGQMQTRKWTDASGVERFSTEIVISRFRGEVILLDARQSSSQGHDEAPDNTSITLDDEIPFG